MAERRDHRPRPAKKPRPPGTYRASNTGPALAGLFLLALVPAVLLKQVPLAAAVAYFLMSPLTFAAYGLDKQRAREGTWRTRENTLHFLALFGGWPGALTAQGWLRHKTRKETFQVNFWLTVILNLAALALSNEALRNSFVTRVLS
jgi:uncharacterized membrane protein YsdA (DUF1294 family)